MVAIFNFNVTTWRHGDVIVIKSQLVFGIKFPTERIFQIFHILKIKKITPICNLVMERPWYGVCNGCIM